MVRVTFNLGGALLFLIWFKDAGQRADQTPPPPAGAPVLAVGITEPAAAPARGQQEEMHMAPRRYIGSSCGRACVAFFSAAPRLAAVFALLVTVPLSAQDVMLRLDWTLGFSYPPNPCIAGSALVSRSLGLFVASSGRPGYAPLTPELGPPELSCGASGSGTAWFDAAEGVALFGAYSSLVRLPGAVSADPSAYAFPPGTAEGDPLVDIDPGAAPFVRLGEVCGGVFCPEPGTPELTLFSFASPGTQVGTLSLAITTVPEPAPCALVLLAAGAGSTGARWRKCAVARGCP